MYLIHQINSRPSNPRSASSNLIKSPRNIELMNDMASTSNPTSIPQTAVSSSNSAITNEKLSKFTLFPKMALELREMVWSQACKVERVVDLWFEPLGGRAGLPLFDTISQIPPVVYRSRTKVPAILHTSKEARATGLKYFTLEFGNKTTYQDGGTTMEFTTSARTYVNWEYDIICPVIYGNTNFASFEAFEDSEAYENFDMSIRYKLIDPAIFPRMRRIAFAVNESVDGSSVGDVLDISKRENIELILYPDFRALMTLKENISDTRKRLNMELVDFDENVHENQYASAGYPDTRDNLLSLKEAVDDEGNSCINGRRLCEKDMENCSDPSHFWLGYPVSFKILKVTITDR